MNVFYIIEYDRQDTLILNFAFFSVIMRSKFTDDTQKAITKNTPEFHHHFCVYCKSRFWLQYFSKQSKFIYSQWQSQMKRFNFHIQNTVFLLPFELAPFHLQKRTKKNFSIFLKRSFICYVTLDFTLYFSISSTSVSLWELEVK